MALFGNKKKAAPKAEPTDKPVVKAPKTEPQGIAMRADLAHVIKHARITEKATMAQVQHAYVFDVATSATKRDVIAAVRSLYKVSPRAVRMVNVRRKTIRSMRTGRTGVKGGGKKAYVYLKAGETINF